MVQVSLTVGKLDASLALLLTKDHHLIEFPTILLPNGIRAGSIVKIKCEQDFETEDQENQQFKSIQEEILNTFGKNLPQDPVLTTKNVTQTSCVLEWEELNLGTSNLKNLFLIKDGKKLGSIPQPLTNRTTKLSGLPIDETFNFQLQLDTTAGVYESNTLEVTTHKMTDLSGINVCLGDVTANEQFSVDDIQDTLKVMGAHYPAQSKVNVDTTHFICTRENKSNPQYLKALEMNIPIIRPEWLKACERDKRIVGVRDYYVKDCVLPDIIAKNFWNKPQAVTPIANPVNDSDKPVPELPVQILNGPLEYEFKGESTANEIHEIHLAESSTHIDETKIKVDDSEQGSEAKDSKIEEFNEEDKDELTTEPKIEPKVEPEMEPETEIEIGPKSSSETESKNELETSESNPTTEPSQESKPKKKKNKKKKKN